MVLMIWWNKTNNIRYVYIKQFYHGGEYISKFIIEFHWYNYKDFTVNYVIKKICNHRNKNIREHVLINMISE